MLRELLSKIFGWKYVILCTANRMLIRRAHRHKDMYYVYYLGDSIILGKNGSIKLGPCYVYSWHKFIGWDDEPNT